MQNSQNKTFSFAERNILLVTIILLAVSFFFDDQILKWIVTIRTPAINEFLSFMTNKGLFYATFALTIFLLIKKQYRLIALMLIAVGVSMESGFILKKIFVRPRPYIRETLATIAIAQTLGFAFPSLHATFCLTVWPFLRKIFPIIGVPQNTARLPGELSQQNAVFQAQRTVSAPFRSLWRVIGMATILIIVFSRIYVGVHYPSDILAGGILGFIVGKIWIHLEEKHKIIDWFLYHVKNKLEMRRQIGHLLTGISIALLYKYNFLNANLLLAILIIGGLTSLASRKYRLPLIYTILKFFDRQSDINKFPGRGSFFLVLGSWLAIIIFPKDIALAAITIMAVGDSITTLIGTYFGKIKNPLNPKKHLEGTVLAIILATIAAFSFVSFEQAFLASIAGMLIESLALRFLDRIIDDNILIPLVAGFVMVMLA